MSFKDHFSGHAEAYARYRPDYPGELFAYLASLPPTRALALDCATGNGQAALGLARHFEWVVASDGSLAQLRKAQLHPRVSYIANLAERPALRSGCVDLVVAAQAAHWFDHERFHPQAQRVLRPGGVIAVWTYGLAQVDAEVDAVVEHFYREIVGPYWPPERRYVVSCYRELPFPWQELEPPAFQLQRSWNLETFIGYIGTWSAVQRYAKARGENPLPALQARLASVWNSGGTPRSVTWRLHLRVGRRS